MNGKRRGIWDQLAAFLQPAPTRGTDLVPVQVMGEGFYQGQLERIAGPKTEDGYSLKVECALVPEPSNPYDENAVAVEIKGATVGYLARPMAQKYRSLRLGPLEHLSAEIRGGWRRRGGDEGHFGVVLFLPRHLASSLGVQ